MNVEQSNGNRHEEKNPELETRRLKVVLQTRQEIEEMIEAMSEEDRAEISPAWLAALQASDRVSPWLHGFRLVHRDTAAVVGNCGFKGPPVDGAVEIAYGIEPGHQGKGYATEAAQALFDFASSDGEVRVVRAHTLPDAAASKRVLEKCGFRYVGEVVDPEDGTVSRFERAVAGPQDTADCNVGSPVSQDV